MSVPRPDDLTRAEGLAALHLALPRLGKSYEARRNTVPGNDDAPTTALLSPWIRHRLLTEAETMQAVVGMHGRKACEKFVQEIFWRTYFKGFLEQHPAIWTRYNRGLAKARERGGPADGARQAEAGNTGIGCFDDWAKELSQTGWLHNHVRMWFASIWIFTLRLPWELGADFFARHLIDFDPASNTLSWRWVAGLHTRGKHYVARAENIARHTSGTYNPTGQLNESPAPIELDEPAPTVALPKHVDAPQGPFALLLHAEDCCPETLCLPSAKLARLAILGDPARRAMIEDTRRRAQGHFQHACVVQGDSGEMPDWAGGLPIVSPYAPIGAVKEALTRLAVPWYPLLRDWDARYWPWCRKGYFQLKTRIDAAGRQGS